MSTSTTASQIIRNLARQYQATVHAARMNAERMVQEGQRTLALLDKGSSPSLASSTTSADLDAHLFMLSTMESQLLAAGMDAEHVSAMRAGQMTADEAAEAMETDKADTAETDTISAVACYHCTVTLVSGDFDTAVSQARQKMEDFVETQREFAGTRPAKDGETCKFCAEAISVANLFR